MLDIHQSFNVPDYFKPGFTPDVVETYLGIGHFKNIEQGLNDLKADMPEFILRLLSIRHKIVARFGFKTEFDGKDFRPFEVDFVNSDFAKIKYEEDNFVFYGELQTAHSDIKGHFAVKFKTIKGRIYFYSIYPAHYFIFKYLMSKMKV